MPPARLLLTKNYVSPLAAGDTDSRHSAMDTWLHEHEHGAGRPLFGLKSWAIFELDRPPTGVTGPSATGFRRPAFPGPPRPRESRGLSLCLCAFQVGVPHPPTVAETHRSSSAGPTSRPRPGQAQEQASGTMRRSGSPDQSRSRKKLRPCHGPWASGGRGQQAQHGRHAGPAQPQTRKEGEAKKFSLTPENAPADAHHGPQRDMQQRGSSVQCLGCTISKRGKLSRPASSRRCRRGTRQHQFGTTIVSATGTNLSSESSGPACPASARIV